MGCSDSQYQGTISKPQVFFLLGGPGSGKGTQSQNLIRDYKFKHLSTGDLLREEQQKGGEYAQQIKSYIKEGKLLPSELVITLLKKVISTHGNRRYLLDGFPRNKENWQLFKKHLSNIVTVRNMIYFHCPTQTLIDRINQRSKSSGRADDNPESVKKRLDTFENQTIPIIKEFQDNNNCLKIDAMHSKQTVYQSVKDALSNANVYPPNPVHMIFVLGGPGSGKGTQCAILVKKYGFIHLSTGDLLREQIKTGSSLGKEIDSVIKQGKLVTSELMVRLIQQEVQRNNYGGRYLLDGFPRGQQNMDVWQKIMAKWVDIKSVIYFECEQAELKKRLLERGKTSGRSDDNEDSIMKRLKVFNEQTKPVIAHYSKLQKLHKFDASRKIEDITVDLEKHLDSIGVFPKSEKINKPKAIIVLGYSGSGKSTQCKKISQQFGFVHISAGDLLRDEIKNKGTHAQLFSECIRQGKLVPSKFIIQLMKVVIQKNHEKGKFILDGFPRNKQNITKWNESLGMEIDLIHMILMECDETTTIARLTKREGARADDNQESIKQKILTFKDETLPVIENYLKQDNFISKVDANLTYEAVNQQIVSILHKKGFSQI